MGQGGRFCTQQADFKGWRFLWAEKQPNGLHRARPLGPQGQLTGSSMVPAWGRFQGIQDRLRIAATVQLLQGA